MLPVQVLLLQLLARLQVVTQASVHLLLLLLTVLLLVVLPLLLLARLLVAPVLISRPLPALVLGL